MPVRYRGLSAGVKYAMSMAQGFLVARRSVPMMRRLERAIRIRENLGSRMFARMPRSDGGDDQEPGPKRRVRSSEAAAWTAASSAASVLVAMAKDNFIVIKPG